MREIRQIYLLSPDCPNLKYKSWTLVKCSHWERSVVQVQSQFQPLYFVHNEFEKLIFNFVKLLTMVILRGRGQVLKSLQVKVGCAIPHSKGLCTIQLKNFNYCHPHVPGPPKFKRIGPKVIALYPYTYIGE